MLKFSGVEFDFSALVICELRVVHSTTLSFKYLNSSSALRHLGQDFHFETPGLQLEYTKLLSPGALFSAPPANAPRTISR